MPEPPIGLILYQVYVLQSLNRKFQVRKLMPVDSKTIAFIVLCSSQQLRWFLSPNLSIGSILWFYCTAELTCTFGQQEAAQCFRHS